MIVGVPRESHTEEKRVALTPTAVANLRKKGVDVVVERGAGAQAGYTDAAYEEKSAGLFEKRDEIFKRADLIVQVRALGANQTMARFDNSRFREGQVLISVMEPLAALGDLQELAKTGVSAFALDFLPRTTRAQNMDVLSSQANIAGYKAVILAAEFLNKIFPMMTTAAGTLAPAKVFVIGAGVAGLQAISTARRLGAVVQAYDVRPAVKEQVQSLGAKFVELEIETAEGEGGYARAMDDKFYEKQRALMSKVLSQCDVAITTAAIPGKRAPILIDNEMVSNMQPGSVIIDIAAERGGNCELTKPGEVVEHYGVQIAGPLNLPSSVPFHASQTFANNVTAFIVNLFKDNKIAINMDDEIIRETLICQSGTIQNARLLEAIEKSQQ